MDALPFRAARSSSRRGRGAIAALFMLVSAMVIHQGVARADWPSGTRLLGLGATLLAPSELGAVWSRASTELVVGWSYQVPVRFDESDNRRHRIVVGLDYLPLADDGHVRGHLAYRYSRSHLFVGMGGTLAYQGNTWSPELGVAFLHRRDEPLNPRMHVLVRPELAAAFDDLRGLTVFVGWSYL